MKIGPTYSSKQFSYFPEDRSFVAEVSNLAPVGSEFMGQLFDDACDYGLWMRSAKTGKLVSFMYEKTKRDAEGDITHWVLRSWDTDDNAHLIELKVFND